MPKKEALKWHTEKRKVKDLELWERNPRKLPEHEREQLEASVKKFDLVEIPAINLDDMICAGHQRVIILTALGRDEEEIDVRVPNRMLTRQEFEEYNARSNRNTGVFDYEMLKQIMTTEKLLSIGFSEEELGLKGASGDVSDLDDLSDQLELDHYVQVKCVNEAEQQKVFERLTKDGYECQVLTL